MTVVFAGVLIIGLAKPLTQQNEYTDPSTRFIGICASCTVAVCFGLVSVLTRKMNKVHFTIVLFYYSLSATLVVLGLMVSINAYNGVPTQLWHYTGEQYSILLGLSAFNTVAMFFNTRALQLESSGFITTINQMGIVYAFLGDIFLFHFQFSW